MLVLPVGHTKDQPVDLFDLVDLFARYDSEANNKCINFYPAISVIKS